MSRIGPVSAVEYLCTAGPHERAFAECHGAWSVSHVQRGSFGCRCRGRQHELVPGALLVGRPGDEYTCTHEHHLGGDACLAVFVSLGAVDELSRGAAWASGAMPPLPELVVWGERLRATAAGDTDLGVDEVAMAFVARFAGVHSGAVGQPARPTPRDRRRAVAAALRIEAQAHEPLLLQALADDAGFRA